MSREHLQGATPGEVAAAINDRLVNDFRYYLDVFTAASHAYKEGDDEQLRVGLYVLSSDLNNEIAAIGRLLWAIWADEKGLEVRS
jgi:hypothetical protein